MPSWWAKPSSKEAKQKTSKGKFFDAIHRKLKSRLDDKKTGKRYSNDICSERGYTLSVSLSPSLEVSRCHSFAEEPRAQPLPFPVQLASVGDAYSDIRTSSMELPICPLSDVYDRRKPVAPDAWGDLGTASVSSNSSMDTNDQTDSRLFSPQASDSEIGNVTATNSPSRPRDRSPLVARKLSKDQGKPVNLPSSDLKLRKRKPVSSNVTKLQIPPHSGFNSASNISISCPSRIPMRTSAQEQVNKSSPGSAQHSVHDASGDMSFVWTLNRCSAECSPILSPRMTSPGCRSHMQNGCATPLHYCAGGLCNDLPLDRPNDGRPQSHKLPLPPVSFSSSFSKNCGREGSSTSPVSRWKKGRLIGSGTFGHVYVGFNSETGGMCAMKEVTLFSDDPKSEECAQQLGQEVTLLSRLRHPNIVQYFGSEVVDNKLYIYLEYISGGSIHKLLGDYGQLGESAIRSFTRQILSGLAYLHARNTAHRDIKGANILVDPSGRVKLADFGMAKHITGQTGALSFKGSPYWMAPEVIRNSNGSNLAVDIWSLGCTVIEMATAKPPWSQYEGVAALFKVGYSKEIPAIPDNLSKEGKDFVHKCLQRNPVDRPTAAQLLDHPFVKNGAPSRSGLLNSLNSEPYEPLHEVAISSRYMGSSHMEKVAGLDLEGVAVQLSQDFKFGSRSSDSYISRHVSCPVSPTDSPLRCSKSSQTTFRKRSPCTSGPRIASGSSTPYNDGSVAHLDRSKFQSPEGIGTRKPQQSLYARVDHRSKQERLTDIPEFSPVNRKTSTHQSYLSGYQIPQLVPDRTILHSTNCLRRSFPQNSFGVISS